MEPGQLRASHWLAQIGGQVLAPSEVTCTSGSGAILDWFVISQELVGFVRQVRVLSDSPTAPHSPVFLEMAGVSKAASVKQRVKWHPFPTRPILGPARQARQASWSWEVGDCQASVEQAWGEWISQAEEHLCGAHDIVGPQEKHYCGSAAGYVLKEVQLNVALRASRRSVMGPFARAWECFEALGRRASFGACPGRC